jgi:hypothetical protein
MHFMMRSIAMFAVCVWLVSGVGGTAAADPPAAPAPTESANAAESQPVKEVMLDPTAKPPVCRRYVPTGSRIAKKRCASADAALGEANRDQLRRDIDEMRMRQAMRDQARAQALAEALRRRGGG